MATKKVGIEIKKLTTKQKRQQHCGVRYSEKTKDDMFVAYKEHKSYKYIARKFKVHHNTAKRVVEEKLAMLKSEIGKSKFEFSCNLIKATEEREDDLAEIISLLGDGIKKKAKNPAFFDSLDSFAKAYGVISDKELGLARFRIEMKRLEMDERKLALEERKVRLLELEAESKIIDVGGGSNNMVNIINTMPIEDDYKPNNSAAMNPVPLPPTVEVDDD